MAVNKVVYKDRTLIDLTEDTVSSSSMLEDVTAHDSRGQQIVGAMINLSSDTVSPSTLKKGITAHDSTGQKIVGTMEGGTGTGGLNTSDATAVSGDILSGKTAYAKGVKVTGSMPNRTGQNVTISQKYGINKIPQGYYNGESTVDIDTQSFNNIVSANIKKGVTILGITGTYEGSSSGGSSGKQVKTGTATTQVINTGLNNIEKFTLYTTSISSIGLVNTEYENGNTEINAIICTYTTSSNKICANLKTKDFSISGGTFEWKYPTFSLMENATYHWIAIGS